MTAFEAHPAGFHITYPNGYTVSVMWGAGNYADLGKTTAEVAVWDTRLSGEPFVRIPYATLLHDQVAARMTAVQVAAILMQVAQALPGEFAIA